MDSNGQFQDGNRNANLNIQDFDKVKNKKAKKSARDGVHKKETFGDKNEGIESKSRTYRKIDDSQKHKHFEENKPLPKNNYMDDNFMTPPQVVNRNNSRIQSVNVPTPEV